MYNSASATSSKLDANFTLTNAFGGNVYIKPSALTKAGDDGAFIIEYNGLSTEACVTIVTGDWGSGQGSGLVGISAYDNQTAEGNDDKPGDQLNNLLASTVSSAQGDHVATPGAHGSSGGVSTPVPVANAIQWCEGFVVAQKNGSCEPFF